MLAPASGVMFRKPPAFLINYRRMATDSVNVSRYRHLLMKTTVYFNEGLKGEIVGQEDFV